MKRFLPLVLILLTGCYTQKKAAKQTDKAFFFYPAMVAKKHIEWFPVARTENIISNTDTLVDIQVMPCDSFVRVDSFETNTAYPVTRWVKVPRLTIRETVTHTITIEDSTKVFWYMDQNRKLQDGILISENKATRRGKYNLWLLVALVISILLNLIQFKRK